MRTQVIVEVLQEIDSEHQELEALYCEFDAFLYSEPACVPILRKRLGELTAILKSHFEHEEEGGYFEEITSMAPRLSHAAQELENEHDVLLARLEHLANRLSTTVDRAGELAALRQEFGEFIQACRTHEHRETALVQEAWLTEIGTGD